MKRFAAFCLVVLSIVGPVLAQKPADVPALLDEIRTLVNKGEWSAALPKIETAVKLNPYSHDAATQLARVNYELKRYPEAIAAYKRVIEMGSGLKGVNEYNLACCLALAGDKKGALDWLETSLKKGYREVDAARTDTDLKSIHGDPRVIALLFSKDAAKMSRDEGWRYDVAYTVRELQRLHFNPYTKHTKKEMDEAARKLTSDVPKLNDSQIVTRLAQLVALCGDGHTAVRFRSNPMRVPLRYLPVTLFGFPDGVFVVAASPAAKEWTGMRLVKVGGHPVGEVMAKLKTCFGSDNEPFETYMAPLAIQSAHLLAGLGYSATADQVKCTFIDQSGKEREADLTCVTERQGPDWVSAADPKNPPHYLKERKPHWTEVLSEQKTLYVAYQAVQNQPEQTVEQFWTKTFEAFDAAGLENMIIDMRSNGGGNNFLNVPMLQGILARPKLNQRGKLFVITGRATYSAAVCGVGQLDRFTNAMFVGLPAGAPPNFIGETIPVVLPYSGLTVTVSDLYWQNSHAMDQRQWIAPDIAIEPTFAELMAGRDPAYESILEYLSKKASG